MQLTTWDWAFIAGFFVISLAIGLAVARRSGKSASDFFLSGRNMPWWLLGVSMVATTFSADTPNLVTDLVRAEGVAGNWKWWAFLVTGMLTVFVYAKLWRRSGVLTDLEFYEMRYSGKEAAFLRAFRAIYLGVVFNVLVMATVCLAAIKIGGVLLGLSPIQTLLIASVITVIYSAIGGLRGIILTDFFQFLIAMVGTLWAASYILDLPQIGSLERLLNHEQVIGKLEIFPATSDGTFLSLLIIPLAVQWWAAYYPGSEPGGGGYVAQRMLAAKDEKNAVGATLLFNLTHIALRPWPWILIALASLVFFPMDDAAVMENAKATMEQYQEISSTRELSTQEEMLMNQAVIESKGLTALVDSMSQWQIDLPQNKMGNDLAYPLMLRKLPAGLLGIVIASLIAAFMSTISTHLNWGSSYIANDVYKRFFKRDAEEKQLVGIGRISTVILMIFSGIVALFLESAADAFDIIVLMGAGTGLLFILRWFWWRINAYSELAAMVISFLVAVTFKFTPLKGVFPDHIELLLSVGITTLGWIVVTLVTPKVDTKTLLSFYKLIRPHSIGWKPVIQEGIQAGQIQSDSTESGKLPNELLAMFMGICLVYGTLFAIGYSLYGSTTYALLGTGIALASAVGLWRIWDKILK